MLWNAGQAALRSFSLSGRSFRCFTDGYSFASHFVSPDGCCYAVDIEVMCPANTFSDLVEVLNNRVATVHAKLPTGSSSGVQITGGSNPDERQIASMVARIDAFAMCLQFQVSR